MLPTAEKLEQIIDRNSYKAKRDDLLAALNVAKIEFDIITYIMSIAMFIASVSMRREAFGTSLSWEILRTSHVMTGVLASEIYK